MYAFYDFGVSGHYRAVVAVLLLVLPFVNYEGHEYAVDAAVDEVLYVAVYELGRETDVVRHNHARAVFVG